MNITHNTNYHYWKLFTIMIRNEYRNSILEAQILYKYEDDDIISAFLAILQKWYSRKNRLAAIISYY